jgi:carbamate kinase
VASGAGATARSQNARPSPMQGVEAVVDKALTTSVLAERSTPAALLVLTDVPNVSQCFGTPGPVPFSERLLRPCAGPRFRGALMGPKVEAACRFVELAGDMGGSAGSRTPEPFCVARRAPS